MMANTIDLEYSLFPGLNPYPELRCWVDLDIMTINLRGKIVTNSTGVYNGQYLFEFDSTVYTPDYPAAVNKLWFPCVIAPQESVAWLWVGTGFGENSIAAYVEIPPFTEEALRGEIEFYVTIPAVKVEEQ